MMFLIYRDITIIFLFFCGFLCSKVQIPFDFDIKFDFLQLTFRGMVEKVEWGEC
jgi:hypothetical protein